MVHSSTFSNPLLADLLCVWTPDYDLCGECFVLPFDRLQTKESVGDGRHLATHDLIKMTLTLPQPYLRWIRSLALFDREQEVQFGFFRQSEYGGSNDEWHQPLSQVVCTHCKERIVSGPFYKCLHQLCCGKSVLSLID
jgi:hypothetical protein